MQYQPYGQFAPQWQPTWQQHPWNGAQQPYQQPQAQQPQPHGVSGRVVSSADEITAQEVPMDGSMGLFPLADGTAVIGKAWGGDGTIRTIRFVPDVKPEPTAETGFEESVLSRLDAIEEALSGRVQRRGSRRGKGADDAES